MVVVITGRPIGWMVPEREAPKARAGVEVVSAVRRSRAAKVPDVITFLRNRFMVDLLLGVIGCPFKLIAGGNFAGWRVIPVDCYFAAEKLGRQ